LLPVRRQTAFAFNHGSWSQYERVRNVIVAVRSDASGGNDRLDARSGENSSPNVRMKVSVVFAPELSHAPGFAVGFQTPWTR
jgi:hypothetical protein